MLNVSLQDKCYTALPAHCSQTLLLTVCNFAPAAVHDSDARRSKDASRAIVMWRGHARRHGLQLTA